MPEFAERFESKHDEIFESNNDGSNDDGDSLCYSFSSDGD